MNCLFYSIEALDGKREVKNSRIQEAKEIMEVTIMLKKVKALVDRFQKEFSEGTLQLNDTFQKLELRKRKIIQILREIYPISTSFDDPNAFAIRGISGNAKCKSFYL